MFVFALWGEGRGEVRTCAPSDKDVRGRLTCGCGEWAECSCQRSDRSEDAERSTFVLLGTETGNQRRETRHDGGGRDGVQEETDVQL